MAEALDPAIPSQVDGMAGRVLAEACRRHLRLVTAESCTGGLLASLLTDIPGCSHAFERGFVVYTDDAKRELLGVPAALLEREGAVSEAVARAMAEGAIAHSRGDIAAAITGFAEGLEGRPGSAGTVHFAVARRGGLVRHRVGRFGPLGRAQIRIRCLETALDLIWESLGGQG